MTRTLFSGLALGVMTVVLLPAASAGAYVNTWSTLPAIPGFHEWGGAATLPSGRIITVAGGSADTDIYSPATNTWSAGAPLPLPRTGLAMVRLGSLVYAIGGSGSSGSPKSGVWAYNETTNNWTVKANLPADRSFLGAAASGGKIYAIGGDATAGIDPTRTVYRYAPSSNTWTTVKPLPAGREGFSTATDNSGRIYVLGGCCNPAGYETKGVYRYTPASNTWAQTAPLSGRNSDQHNLNTAATLGSDGQIYVLGGGDSKYAWSTTRVYNPATNGWHDGADMPHEAEAAAAATGADGVIYVLGSRAFNDGCGVGSDLGFCPHQAFAYH